MGLFNKKETNYPGFNMTKRVGAFIEFDDDQKKWLIPDKKNDPQIYLYSDIIDCDLLEDEESLTSGGLGRAIAGGVLFGGVGAVVGGITGKRKTKNLVKSMKVKITLNNLNTPIVYITLINTPIKTDSIVYKTLDISAQEILSIMAIIIQQNQEQATPKE